MFPLRRSAAAVALCLVGSIWPGAHAPAAQDFPTRTVKLVVPQTAGGTTDVLARAIAGKLGEKWKQNVIVENIGGASGSIGTQMVSQAAPDGYTLLLTYEGSQAINPHVIPNQNFDAVKDFVPIATLARAGFLLIGSPNLPVNTFAEFLALAREKPDGLTYGSAGAGSANHLIGEMLKSQAKVRVQHVPYRGIAQAITNVMGGQIDTAVVSIPSVIGQIQAGSVKALAVTSSTRSSAAPNVPTAAESGLPGFDVTPWWGILGPAKMEPRLAAKIAADLNGLLASEEMQAVFRKQGAEPFVTSSAEFGKLLAADVEKWGKIVAAINLK